MRYARGIRALTGSARASGVHPQLKCTRQLTLHRAKSHRPLISILVGFQRFFRGARFSEFSPGDGALASEPVGLHWGRVERAA